jgi:hypothetical protein
MEKVEGALAEETFSAGSALIFPECPPDPFIPPRAAAFY